MRIGAVGRVLRAVLLAAGAGLAAANAAAAKPAGGAQAPGCGGRDLLTQIRAQDAAAAKRIDQAAKETRNGEALLWKISRDGVLASYLYGTIHLSDPRVTTFAPQVQAAIDGAQTVALEVADLSPAALGQAMGRIKERVVFVDGRSLAGLLTPEEHQQAKAAALRSGLPEQLFSVARPWLVTMLLSVSDCERQRAKSGLKAVDLAIGALARSRGVPVVGLETLEDQLAAMAAIPEDDQVTILKASLKLEALSDDAVETILSRYLAREIGKVWPIQRELWRKAGFGPGAFVAFRRELITKRNHRMRDAALPLLEKGGAFVAVGALHLIGREGLVELLREAGYSVSAAE